MRYLHGIVALYALLLTSCATTTAAPLQPSEPVVMIRQVNVPVPVPCVTTVPAAPMLQATPNALAALSPDFAGAWNGIALLKGDIAILMADGENLRAVLRGCVGPNK